MEALAAVDGSGCAGNTFQLSDLSAFAQSVHDVLGSQLSAPNVVRCDLAVDFNAVDSTVNRDHANALCHGCLNSTGNSIGVNGVNNQDGDTLGNQVFDVGNLLGHIVACVNNGQIQVQISCSLFCTLNQSDKEGVVLGRNGQADRTLCGVIALEAFLAIDDDTAGCQGHDHGHTQDQGQNFLQFIHIDYLHQRFLSDSTATRMTSALMTS